ncbi:glycosyltransferase family 4 protein [Iningainema tapete]|uniref:Glycosyltransferase family 4 protein n=1 Tax=Iningainema tapete BLCC-T55 TaxID=2748662 RepID=A0A8J7CAP7_9CYAN|nr:glycosyltransferase family 4 protein [Iningainema tapete]MBD2777376.1 glycosyltransferase family 4 protein [Iningainema tapete BLCC-T55]
MNNISINSHLNYVQTREEPRIAWLFPALSKGKYWQQIFSEFSKTFEKTVIYTGDWQGFSQEYQDQFKVKIVGKSYSIKLNQAASLITVVSPKIIGYLISYKPHVIFTSGFSIWTVVALLLKLWMRWRVVILYDGSTPSVDHINSAPRLFLRRLMSQYTDAFNANNKAAQEYLTKILGIEQSKVFLQPYLVPDAKVFLKNIERVDNRYIKLTKPIFLYAGDINYNKGIHSLLKACSLLRQQGYHDFTVMLIGDGEQREEFANFAKAHNLENHVVWTGWIKYEELGAYFKQADVFVFPSFDDVWGMVVSEAMLLSKPILCSKKAGVSEIIVESENGYLFAPDNWEELAQLMQKFIDNPSLIELMGKKSQQLIAHHTPQLATEGFVTVVSHVLEVCS